MPTPQRRQPIGVIARLLATPHRFGFFQAVRLLDRWFGKLSGAGNSDTLSEHLRFRNTLSLGFPASEIAELRVIEVMPHQEDSVALRPSNLRRASTDADADADPATLPRSERQSDAMPSACSADAASIERIEITPAFMGLLGSAGALPILYTELLADRELYHRDTAARAFLDIFQHRAVTLFYKAWRKHRLPIQYERDPRNQFVPLVLAVAGVGQSSLRDRLRGAEGGVADNTLAYFSGLLQQRPVSAHVVQQIVSDYFRVPATVEQFIGRWFTLPPDSVTSLGLANAALGTSAMIGKRVWQHDLRMRLTLGPMLRDSFHAFLPGRSAALALRELLTLLTGVTLEYEVRLSLRADQVRGTKLDETDAGALLGWNTFLVSQAARVDRHDAGYDIHALA